MIDPTGRVLLSSDAIEDREFVVTRGVVAANVGTHDDTLGNCPGSIAIQLLPHGRTPNLSGAYKVWVTRVADYLDGGVGTSGAGPNFGFVDGHVKTDNFTVREDRFQRYRRNSP